MGAYIIVDVETDQYRDASNARQIPHLHACWAAGFSVMAVVTCLLNAF